MGPRMVARTIQHQQQTPVATSKPISINFEPTVATQIAFSSLKVPVEASQHITISLADGTNFKEAHQCDTEEKEKTDCLIIFAFMAQRGTKDGATFKDTAKVSTVDDSTKDTKITTVTLNGSTPVATASASVTSTCRPPDNNWFPTVRSSLVPPGNSFPSGSEDLAIAVVKKFDSTRNLWGEQKEAVINCYYQTNSQLAFFTQIRSIYNAMSTSTTVAANIGSYNFNNGMQLSLGTNIQAGPAGPSNKAVAGPIPTLTATGSAQAAQNLFYGGNLYIYDEFPVLIKKDSGSIRWHFLYDILAREGVDIQNFNGTTTTATSPTTHFNLSNEMYWQYDADPQDSPTPPLAVFLGGQYGYAYTAVRYAQQYGFLNKSNAQVGAISLGLIVTGQFDVTVLRQFGPSQKFIDSSTGAVGVVNNFKSWSFGIQYQTKGISTSK